MALRIVGCLTRFSICPLVADCKSVALISAILNDRIRQLGKPRRIIMDNGPPGMFGTDWGEFSHTYAIQLVHAPKSAPYQNGLAERVARSLNAALKAIPAEDGIQPSQRILTQAVMGRDHVPQTVTGIPPVLEMTGRCDLLAVRACTDWSRNPDTADPAILQANAMRNILNARSAVMAADAERTLITCLQRNMPGRSHEFCPIGASVQIALRGEWVGTYRVIAHATSNLSLEKGRKILKWHKVTTRLIIHDTDDVIDTTVIPDEAENVESEQEDTATTERQIPRPRNRPAASTHPVELGDVAEERDDFWPHWSTREMSLVSHQFPGLNFINQGVLMCEHQWNQNGLPPVDSTYSQYSYPVTDTLAPPLTDQDILGHSDPSRLPPRSAFRLPLARLAIEKEIGDLLRKDHHSPPAMIEVSLNEQKYRHLPRIPITLAVKRKRASLYKCRLCTRGDVVPLTVTGFMSSPTTRRASVKLVCAIAMSLKWDRKALGISQAFLQSENLRAEDRIGVIPPPMVTMPWKGSLPAIGTDLGNPPRPSRGFLLLRPLYGCRDAPMRWRITLSGRIRSYGFTQLRSDVCMFAKHDCHRNLTSYLVCHVGDILFTGCPEDLKIIEAMLRTFRAGEIESLSVKSPILFTGFWSNEGTTALLPCHGLTTQTNWRKLPQSISSVITKFRTMGNCALLFVRQWDLLFGYTNHALTLDTI